MIKFLFTTRDGFGSKIISKYTAYDGQDWKKDVPAHMSILFFDTILIESRFRKGVFVSYWGISKKKVRVIKAFRRVETQHVAHVLNKFKMLVEEAVGDKYDWKGVTYLGWRHWLRKRFKKKLPVKNKFEEANRWFCNELHELFPDGQESSMYSPNDTMLALIKHDAYKECEV